MNKSIFVRFLLAPLVAMGIVIGLAVSPLVLPPKAKAAPVVSTSVVCKALLKNDRVEVDPTDSTKYLVKVYYGCSTGDISPCRIGLDWRIYDANDNFTGASANDISLACGSGQRTVTFDAVTRTTDALGNPLPDGWYYFEYKIYRYESGHFIDDPIVGGEWYQLLGQVGSNGRSITPLSRILFAANTL